MAQYFEVHPTHPQPRLLKEAAKLLGQGGLIAMPTDACYVLIAPIGDKDALERLRRIRGIDDRQLLSLMCRDLSDIATYAQVDNQQYRLLKSATPGPYVFILPATREVPRKLAHPSRRTIGLRIPDHPVALGLLEAHGQPVICSTLQLPGDDEPMTDGAEIRDRLQKLIAGVIDDGGCGIAPTTVIDLSEGDVRLVRKGSGSLDPFPGLDEG